MTIRAILLTTGLLCGTSALVAESAPIPAAAVKHVPAGVSAGPSLEGISEFRLRNGMRVLLFPDHSQASITLNMTYLVGSRHENYGETGMAHLLEHLLFKGTKQRRNLPQEFEKRGMQFNGTTDIDRTNYYASFAANEESLHWLLALEADRMVNSNIAKHDLDSEMSVVRNEFESGENSPNGVLLKRIFGMAYDWHNVGKPTIGNRSDIENVKISNLQAFYRQYYQPDNAVLLVAGKFDPDQALSHIAKYFSPIPKPKRTLPQFWTREPVQDGERSVVVRRNGSTQTVVLAYKIPAALHPDSDAIAAVGEILADRPNGRLHKSLVEGGRASAVFSYTKNGVDPGLMMVGAVLKQGEPTAPVVEAIIAAMENLAPISTEELQRFQRRTALQYEQLQSDPQQLAVALSEAIALGDWRLLFWGRDKLAQLQTTQLQEAAARYLRRDNRNLALFIPEDKPLRAEIAHAPSAGQVLRDYRAKSSSLSGGEAFDSSQEFIEKRTELTQIGALKLALLPKKSRGEQVMVDIRLHWGNADNLRGKSAVASLTEAMLMRGTSKYTRAQLADEMDKLKMSGSPYSFQTTRANLPAALELACHILRQPAFPDGEWEQLKKQSLVALDMEKNDPQSLAQMALEEHINPWPQDDPRGYRDLARRAQDIQAVSLEQVRTFHQEFYGASQGEIAIVGDFDAGSAKQALHACFQNWPSKAQYARLTDKNKAVPAVRKQIHTPDKENAVYLAHLNLDLAQDDADYPALLLANHMFGSGGMDARLLKRIRQQDGLSYGGHSSLGGGRFDRAGNFSIMAIAAPHNVSKLEHAIKQELQRALQHGFSEEELAKAKSALLKERSLNRSKDNILSAGWVSYLEWGRTYAYSREFEQKLQAVTLAQVNQTFARYIAADQLSVFIALDEAKTAVNKELKK